MFDLFREDPIIGLIALMALITAFTIHEFGHALSAKLLGDDTAERAGRLTLNPAAHVDILGLILLFFTCFGWAKPVPIDPDRFKNKKVGEIVVSLAGVFFNFMLGFIAALLIKLMFSIGAIDTRLFYFGVNHSNSFSFLAYIFLRFLLSFNIGLMIFNLIPVPPLDGSRVVETFLKGKAYFAYKKYAQWGQFVLLFLLLATSFGNILNPIAHSIVKFIAKLIDINPGFLLW